MQTSRLTYKHATAPKEWSFSDQTGRRDADRSRSLASREAISVPLRRFLRFSGRTYNPQYVYNLPNASGCEYLRCAGEERKNTERQTQKERQEASLAGTDGQKNSQLQAGQNLRARQEQRTACLCQKSCLVQGIAATRAAGYQSRSDGQREGRLSLHHGFEPCRSRSNWRFCGSMEYRGYFQEHQTAYRRPGASDVEGPRSRTRCGDKFLVVFGHLALVSSKKNKAQILHYPSVVSGQACSELCRCFELSSRRTLAGKN